VSSILVLGCGQGEPPTPTGRVAVAVAPLSLPGIVDADYTLTVDNGSETVWTRDLSSSGYGDGAGSLSYVGTCDADAGTNTVTLTLTALHDASGEVPTGEYMHPTPISRDVACVANADVAVDFELTVARRANQGFFDVAVEFEDVFCSAKLDCEAPDGSDLELLHDDTGARELTMVMAFACTGRATAGGSTYLYMDDPIIDCAGQGSDVRVDAAGTGNLDLTAAPNANPGDYLFGAAVYRGVEGLANKAYWNLSFGLDRQTIDDFGACRLRARATASSDAWPQQALGFPLPPGSVYPVVDWDVLVSDASGRRCGRHAVNVTDSGVATDYLGYLPSIPGGFTWANEPIYLQHRYGDGVVLSAGGPICNPSCANGGTCAATDTCDCTGTGYGGTSCETPACSQSCDNGGSCVAPDTCACLNGFWGDACENACTAVEHCAVPPTCTDASDSECGACDTGYLPDGAGGCVECLSAADCSDDANPCTVKACEAGACVQNPGNAGAECRASAGDCDVAELCDGASATCPSDGFVTGGTECRASAGDCDVAELCSGSDAACPVDGFLAGGTECRGGAGDCDVAEQCTGSGPACPVDGFLAGGTECRGVAGLCDVAEQCSGSDAACPVDGFVAGGTECRAAVDACDVAELCGGSDAACPGDGFATAGTACGDGSDSVCDHPDSCDGGGGCLPNYEPASTVCRADAGACDVPEYCTGAGSCPSESYEPNGTSCADATFCDGAEICSDGVCVDQDDPCDPATSVCEEGPDQCAAIYTSCLDALDAGETVSQLYWIDPDGTGSIPVRQVYCDQLTDGGGWMLMAKFSQNQSIDGADTDLVYNAFFGGTGGAMWIEGSAMTTPSSVTLEEDNYHVESFAWAEYMVADHAYELRQNFFKLAGAATFDAAFRFTYSGETVQDDISTESQRAWQLLDRRELTNTTGVTFQTVDPYFLFWLPFSASATGNLYSGCSGYQLSADGCGKSNADARRFGNAGVIGLVGDNNDPAGAWAPHMNRTSTFDLVYIHQANGTYGVTGDKMALLYWIREERCESDAECDSGYCDLARATCGAPQESCLALYGLGQHTVGTYTIDPDGPGANDVPYEVVCDMTNGGWTRVAYEDFESGTTSGWNNQNGVSLCGPGTSNTNHIVGGYFAGWTDGNTVGNDKTYTWNPVPHTEARLDFAFYKIDSWDAGDVGYVDFGGTNIFAQEYCFCSQTCGAGAICSTAPTPLSCGSANWAVEVRTALAGYEPRVTTSSNQVDGIIPHTGSSAVVHGGSSITQTNDDESWGLDDIVIWVK